MKKLRAKWPKHLIVPSPEDFTHGEWVNYECDDDGDDECRRLKTAASDLHSVFNEVSKKEREALKYSCSTHCCIVGWTALAMDENGAMPHMFSNPATAKFLNKFIELAGYTPLRQRPDESQLDFIERVAYTASDVFEDRDSQSPYGCVPKTGGLSPEQAHEMYVKTARFFGYDVESMI